jgi:hypothetical protein
MLSDLLLHFQTTILEQLFVSVLAMKDDTDLGPAVFQDLVHDRYGNRSQVLNAIKNNEDVALIGGPGQGKTTLMHFLFMLTSADRSLFPIILDFRRAQPRDQFGLMREFSLRMQEYFRAIGRPAVSINDEPTPANYDIHYALLSTHLDSVPLQHITATKRLVLFLDDLDYMDEQYIAFLKKYFLSYTISEKAMVVMSGRRPLFNALSDDDELYHAFRMRPFPVELQPIDLQAFIHARLGSICCSRSFPIGPEKMTTVKRRPTTVTALRKAVALRLASWIPLSGVVPTEQDYEVDLGFPLDFFTSLAEATGRNLATVERLLPGLWKYERRHPNRKPSFAEDFIAALLECVGKDETEVHDLVYWKSDGAKKKHCGNAVLQIVLEYFALHETADERFFRRMEEFGISNEMSRDAISRLSGGKMGLIEPDGVYTGANRVRIQRYLITEKGRFYARRLLRRDEYYQALGHRKGADHPPAERSKRSFLDEVERR